MIKLITWNTSKGSGNASNDRTLAEHVEAWFSMLLKLITLKHTPPLLHDILIIAVNGNV